MGGPPDKTAIIAKIVQPFLGRTGGLIAALRAVQSKIGYLPPETEAIAGSAFNLTRAEVKGVISFYSDFHREPKGRLVIRLCAAEACQAQGGRELEREICRRFALGVGEKSASGDLTLEHVYCLGLCSTGPAAMVDGKLMAKATLEKLSAVFHASERARK